MHIDIAESRTRIHMDAGRCYKRLKIRCIHIGLCLSYPFVQHIVIVTLLIDGSQPSLIPKYVMKPFVVRRRCPRIRTVEVFVLVNIGHIARCIRYDAVRMRFVDAPRTGNGCNHPVSRRSCSDKARQNIHHTCSDRGPLAEAGHLRRLLRHSADNLLGT